MSQQKLESFVAMARIGHLFFVHFQHYRILSQKAKCDLKMLHSKLLCKMHYIYLFPMQPKRRPLQVFSGSLVIPKKTYSLLQNVTRMGTSGSGREEKKKKKSCFFWKKRQFPRMSKFRNFVKRDKKMASKMRHVKLS